MGDFSLHENNMDYHQDNLAVFFTIIKNTKLLIKKTRQEQASIPSLARTTNKSKQRKTSAGSLHHHESKSCQEDLPFSNKALLSKDFPKPMSSIKIESSEACKLVESFTSRDPHWKHLMTKCNVEDHCTLHIATEFACKYILEAVKQIILRNSEGKFWEVEVACLRYQNKSYTQIYDRMGKIRA
ncbi:hypothetical protein glysoja_010244 [Glycine soja]|nr:hypothetical protein glysoja_010244 [Glycine soja]